MAAELEPSNGPTKTKNRSPNWTAQEDEQLAISWLYVSQKPEHERNQTGTAFYEKLELDFNNHSKVHYRDAHQIKTRWAAMHTSTLKFSVLYHNIQQNPPSGTSHIDWMRTAKQLYAQQNRGFAFKDELAWQKLRYVSKWKTGKEKEMMDVGSKKPLSVLIRCPKSTPPRSSRGSTLLDTPSSPSRSYRSESTNSKRPRLDSSSIETQEQITDQSSESISDAHLQVIKETNRLTREANHIARQKLKLEQTKIENEIEMNHLKLIMTSEDHCPDHRSKLLLRKMKDKLKGIL